MYDITFDPSWVANHGSLAAEIELWVVGPIADGFAPNVNVLTQLVPELDIDGYIEVSADSSPRFISNFELIDSGIVEGSSGQMLGFMEYLGALGGPLVHALAVFVLADGIAVIATLVALPDDFDELRETIEPLLLTLRRT